MSKKLSHIELFAGCGGMSLGLEAAGFELYFANELSPMASETFAYNLLGEDLDKHVENKTRPEKVYWIKSRYPVESLKQRLKENPFEFQQGKFSDLPQIDNFKNKLLVGNIDHLLKYLAHNKSLCRHLQSLNIDLLSGGPPCQGFSLAGKREKDDQKNLLPLSFAKFAGLVKPKIVLLENVKGITAPFTVDGKKYYAWLEISKAFSLQGFVPICMLLNSKYFGIPQNRPRFILLGIRKDIFDQLNAREENSDTSKAIFNNSLRFFQKVKEERRNLDVISTKDIRVYDIESSPELFDGNLLPRIITSTTDFIPAKSAIGDISTIKDYNLSEINSEYPSLLNKLFVPKHETTFNFLQNHEIRKHSYKVKARFRFYQLLNDLNGLKALALNVITGKIKDDKVIEDVFDSLKTKKLFIYNENGGSLDILNTPEAFKVYIQNIQSRKHSQRAIREEEPAPAQLTIPDDLCHYSEEELRTFTVREMARFQSFPDWFVFRSKATTGGKHRAFQVPQYTQVGNAVPPILAFELGKTVNNILKPILTCEVKQG